MIDGPIRAARCRLVGLEDAAGRRSAIGETVIMVDDCVPQVVFVHCDCFVLFANLSRRGEPLNLVYAQERPFYADASFKPAAAPRAVATAPVATANAVVDKGAEGGK